MTRRPARVIGLGLAVVDEILLVDDFGNGVRERYTERRVGAGGMVSNALCQVAALGVPAELVSAVGDDSEGRFLRRELRAAGVGTRRLLHTERLPTTVAVVRVRKRDGERRFWVAERRVLERRAPAFDVETLREGDVLLVDGHFAREARRAVRRAREIGAAVVGDFNRPHPECLRLLPALDHAIVPEEFAREYAGSAREALLRLEEQTRGAPVVTLGARGGIFHDGARVRRYAARPTRVRDTTGAGDAFHGAFCAGLVLGLPLEERLALASHAASLACTALGARGRLMQAAERSRWRPPRAFAATRRAR